MVQLILCKSTKGTVCNIVRPAKIPKADIDANAAVEPSFPRVHGAGIISDCMISVYHS